MSGPTPFRWCLPPGAIPPCLLGGDGQNGGGVSPGECEITATISGSPGLTPPPPDVHDDLALLRKSSVGVLISGKADLESLRVAGGRRCS